MCGEKAGGREACSTRRGSPPRVRGEVLENLARQGVHRITPACAGRSRRCTKALPVREDHPRVCGEKLPESTRRTAEEGSPPRVRGEGKGRSRQPLPRGITPACAGRRRYIICPIGILEDHPRVCGEKKAGRRPAPRSQGSPPRVRGEDVPGEFEKFASRITPACAGRSKENRWHRRHERDHPRVCGEKAVVNPRFQSARGSPPRVRGEVV